ncbi:MAG: Spx/MgsR family RNA polymerase-binding regulatory protein [Polyangiaceae bacterium]
MSNRPRIYSYSGCGTCKKALNWLKGHGIESDVLPIREQPPSEAELEAALKQVSSVRALFNTSGGDYKSMGLKDRLPTMTPKDAITLLAKHGNLVKRPFIVLPRGRVLVGFDEAAFTAEFANSR